MFHKLVIAKGLVGASGFEPPASWSRTRCQHLLKSTDSCWPEVIPVEPFARALLNSMEMLGIWKQSQLQIHLHLARLPLRFRQNSLRPPQAYRARASSAEMEYAPRSVRTELRWQPRGFLSRVLFGSKTY